MWGESLHAYAFNKTCEGLLFFYHKLFFQVTIVVANEVSQVLKCRNIMEMLLYISSTKILTFVVFH